MYIYIYILKYFLQVSSCKIDNDEGLSKRGIKNKVVVKVFYSF